MSDFPRAGPIGRPGLTRPKAGGPAQAVVAATETYLRGEQLDMSALATELGIGRATLYRWVGNREDLLAAVLADATERAYAGAVKGAQGEGVPFVLDCLRRYMSSVLVTPAIKALTQREPLLFIRLVTMPGAIEDRPTQLIADVLERQAFTGRIRLALPSTKLALAIIRICDAHLYAHLLGRNDPPIENALEIVAMLLDPPRFED